MSNGLPDIIIGGAPRSGTTFLCHVLDRHPEVYVARPFIPEPKICLTPSPAGPSGYLARYQALFSQAKSDQILVEKTSNYLENEDAFSRLVECLPVCRFMFIFREPISRAYSNYLWTKKNGLETLSFAEALRLEGSRVDPLAHERPHARPFDYLARAEYGTFVRRYIEAYGRKSVLCLLYEDIRARPVAFYDSLHRFCGLRDKRPAVISEVGVINATEDAPLALSKNDVERLRERMKPLVEEFASVTGVDVGVWGY